MRYMEHVDEVITMALAESDCGWVKSTKGNWRLPFENELGAGNLSVVWRNTPEGRRWGFNVYLKSRRLLPVFQGAYKGEELLIALRDCRQWWAEFIKKESNAKK